jgi:hypothetical protein
MAEKMMAKNTADETAARTARETFDPLSRFCAKRTND